MRVEPCLVFGVIVMLLVGCGNKGPLYRAEQKPSLRIERVDDGSDKKTKKARQMDVGS